MYNKKDFPNLPKTPNDRGDNNSGNGNLVFTRSSLSRMVDKMMILTAFTCGVMYVLSAYNEWKGGSKQNNNSKNGK